VAKGIGQNGVHVRLVLEDDVIENLEGKLGKLDREMGGLEEPLSFLLAHPARDAPGQPHNGVDHLSPQGAYDVAAFLAHPDHLARDLQADPGDHAQDVALGSGSIGPDDEIRPAEKKEVDVMIFDHKSAIDQLAEQPCRPGRLDLPQVIQGLGRSHVMGRRADATDARRDPGHLFRRPTYAEPLKAPQLRNLEKGAFHVPVLVQKDLDLAVAFQPGNGIDRDSP